MGGLTCEIIILCGALKSSALELHDYISEEKGEDFRRLRSSCTLLAEFESEICDGAEAFGEYATPEEKELIFGQATQAKALWTDLHDYVEVLAGAQNKHKLDLSPEDVRKQIDAFVIEQFGIFSAIADAHKYA